MNKTLSALLLFAIFSILSAKTWADESRAGIVLVTSKQSTINTLSVLEARKLFLGIPIIKDKMQLTPMINHSDDNIQKIFLQHTVFMTETAYKRQLLRRAVKFGVVLPRELVDTSNLVQELTNDPSAVSYIWSSDIVQYPELKIVAIH